MSILDEFGCHEDDIDAQAEREGIAICQLRQGTLRKYRCPHLKTGKVKPDTPIDILEILNVVH